MENFICLLPVAGDAQHKTLLIQVIVIEDDCIVTFKPVALFTQAIAELVQNGDYPFFLILPYAVRRM